MADALVLSIDQGTTSSRALAFDREGKIRGSGTEGIPTNISRRWLGRA